MPSLFTGTSLTTMGNSIFPMIYDRKQFNIWLDDDARKRRPRTRQPGRYARE